MIKKWKTLKDEIILKGGIFRYRKVERVSETNAQLHGHFDVLDFLDWVNVFALTPDKQVILVKQYRHGIDDVTLEVPAGAIHLGEEPILAAKRELLEETGFESHDWTELGFVSPNPAIQSNRCFFFLAKDCRKIQAQELDPLEEIEVLQMPLDEFSQSIQENRIHHALVVSCYMKARQYL